VIQNFDFTEALLPAAMRWLAADVDEDDIHKICALTLANTMSSMPQGDLARFAGWYPIHHQIGFSFSETLEPIMIQMQTMFLPWHVSLKTPVMELSHWPHGLFFPR